ncbi:SMC family ATPase [Pilimelia columellifera]|uniref:Nuclease SbcCD subunit C n=1 Tax=Pilimelia columellifera subsp. columellifera TaxID=706583 RepID=A0ABN3NN64_9ACTN
MRPLRLDLAGFTVFRDETTIDFTDADFFALVGPTGAGKSTILDGICFALYGTAPRWNDRRGVGNALAPSSTEARVRLVFESAGGRYVATRVARRDGKGRVSTAHAGLEQLPDGFDLRRLDDGLTPDDLGEVLAGTPAQMEAAVLAAVGLPYEQFTTCVVLPQGEFAEFLHAKPAARQQILVNLLGLHVYERVRERATVRAAQAEAQLAAVDQVLVGLGEVPDDDLAAAERQIQAATGLAAAVEAATPRLHAAREQVTQAEGQLSTVDGRLARLGAVETPGDVAELAAAVADARRAAAEAGAAVEAAEEREEKLRGELAAGQDPSTLRLALDAHAEQDELTARIAAAETTVATAAEALTAAEQALTQRRERAAQASSELERARATYAAAQAADRAAALRAHLVVGADCPVCAQPVAALPAPGDGGTVAAAEAAGHAARTTADAAEKAVAKADAAAQAARGRWERASAERDQWRAQQARLLAKLADSPGQQTLRAQLAELEALRARLDDATGALRAAREADRAARARIEAAQARVGAAWQAYDLRRDTLADLSPPTVAREDLATAWQALTAWSVETIRTQTRSWQEHAHQVESARAQVAAVDAEIAGLFAGAGLDEEIVDGAPGQDPGRAAAVAVERTQARWRRLVDRREQGAALREQRGEHERQAHVAKALATHLRANNFERWLLAEALDLLVEGASGILRELSGGQYELVHDKGEFFVLDHHDAGLRRAVRTLSGGETFQASLALALALSEQLAGMSSTSASLESIILDEGFGTLDAATLDTVAATLETLASRGDRMVGVVTHVPALAERAPVRFEVTRDARSARVERTGL